MLLATPRFWYGRRLSWQALLLWPLAWIYGRVVLWQQRHIPAQRLPVPVISVGNITLGGTGKTPLVIALARELRGRGYRVAVLLRGYGAKRQKPVQVRDGLAADQVGDEALELHRALPEVPIWVGRDRCAAGRAAIAAGADLLLLDDGLQHWPLARDCDISVLAAEHGLGNGWVFPAGPLREPRHQLGRADLLVLLGADAAAPGSNPGQPPSGGGWPRHKPWFRLASWVSVPEALRTEPLFAFCGIGLPGKFFRALRVAGLQLVGTEAFPDHHPYAQAQMEQLQRRARAHGATLVTTRKDWQRLALPWREQVVAVPLELDHPTVVALASAALIRVDQARSAGGIG